MPLKKLLFLNLLVLLFISLVLAFGFLGQPSPHEPVLQSDLKVGALNLGGLTLSQAIEKLDAVVVQETLIGFPHKVEHVTYRDMGIRVNEVVLPEYLEKCKSLLCWEKPNPVPLTDRVLILDEKVFEEFVEGLEKESQAFLEGPEISFDNLSFSARDASGVVTLDGVGLKNQLRSELILAGAELAINTHVEYPEGYEAQKQATENLVSKATANSMLIKYGRQPIYVPATTLASFVETTDEGGPAVANVSKVAIEGYLSKVEEDYTVDVTLEKKYAILSIAHALLFRVGGESPYTSIILPSKGEPNTDGSYAKKYLEIDKSQQRMYAWLEGKVVDTYIVGTGLLLETPTGNFQVLRKDRMAIAYHDNWFMPYYMPLGLLNGGFFGLHEIPYQVNGSGNIVSRNINTMGSPATSGCIQLYQEDVIYLFNEWADIGMPVVIFN